MQQSISIDFRVTGKAAAFRLHKIKIENKRTNTPSKIWLITNQQSASWIAIYFPIDQNVEYLNLENENLNIFIGIVIFSSSKEVTVHRRFEYWYLFWLEFLITQHMHMKNKL